MIWLNPTNVSFGSDTYSLVESVAIDRDASRLVVEHGDDGPHAVFADVPKQRVTVRIVRRVSDPSANVPSPGAMAELSFDTSANASLADARRITVASAVVSSVTHTLTRSDGGRQTIVLVAVSSDGATDPVQNTPIT